MRLLTLLAEYCVDAILAVAGELKPVLELAMTGGDAAVEVPLMGMQATAMIVSHMGDDGIASNKFDKLLRPMCDVLAALIGEASAADAMEVQYVRRLM